MTGPIYGRTITAPPLRIVDDGLIICRSKQALKGKRGGSSMALGISNDNGKTVSNTIEISFRSHLPRLLSLTQPTVIFADNQRVDMSFRGSNLYTGIQILLTN